MRYIPKDVDAQVNLPDRHPLADLVWLGGGLLLIIVVVYLLGGFLIDQLVRFIPPEYDNRIGAQLPDDFLIEFGEPMVSGEQVERTHAIFEQLKRHLPNDDPRAYRLVIIDTPDINALAIPGGTIVVFRGLLDAATSENEVAMVLAHEFGHIYHQHHWRRLGRLALLTTGALLVGSNTSASNQIAGLSTHALFQGSNRQQEAESDRFGVELLCRYYGHGGGASDFFERHIDKDTLARRSISLFLTHPLSQERVDAIHIHREKIGCTTNPLSPWLTPSATPLD
ncbi:MAG: M48 family metallopeptidase [Pseudomonadota bacterium]